MSPVIIYGPQGCGKTLNGEELRKAFGCTEVLELDDCKPYQGRNAWALKNGTLYLTSDPGVAMRFSTIAVPFSKAIKRVPEALRLPKK